LITRKFFNFKTLKFKESPWYLTIHPSKPSPHLPSFLRLVFCPPLALASTSKKSGMTWSVLFDRIEHGREQPCPPTKEYEMTLKCPKCHSKRIETKNYAKKTGSTIGTVAGAARGAAGVVAGAEIGAAAGLIAGPVGATIGSIAGAIIGGLVGGAVGGAAGAMLGEVVDDNILNNYQCLACGYTFSKKDTSLNADDSACLDSNRHVD
jgi:rubredoxin